MKNEAKMYSLSSKLWYDKRWISKSGDVSLYLQVTLNGKHKEFPLKLKWPADRIDLTYSVLLPRRKKDPEVDDYNILIGRERARHVEILLTYRIRRAPIDIETFARELKSSDCRESFTAYMQRQIIFRYNTKDIAERTKKNHLATLEVMLAFDKVWPLDQVDGRWMKRFKSFLVKKGKRPGGIWANIKEVKTYLQFVKAEPMMTVCDDAVNFKNEMPTWSTVFLNEDEVRRLMILLRAGSLSELQERVLKAFLFQCFTSLRISDVYRANSNWRIEANRIHFIPKKGEKHMRWHSVEIMPMANHFINSKEGFYFDLPNEAEYNLQLKNIAVKADIKKNLTSHIGRHTYGHLYMKKNKDVLGLKEILGHSKIETTLRYAHLDTDHQTEAVMKIQESFSDLILYKVK